MAKTSSVMRNLRRIDASKKAKSQRVQLKTTIVSEIEQRDDAVIQLQKRPRDESSVRVRNRCSSCGRPRGTLRKFGLCRICLREAFNRGDVPGMRKASW